MPSSISNSSQRAPSGPWARTWVLAMFLAAVVLGLWELHLRTHGHQPSVTDDMLLWAVHRRRVYPDADKQTVVVLGASRASYDFVPEVFEKHCPACRVVDLALPGGGSPVAVLRDLAEDPQFRGVVLVDLFPSYALRSARESQQAYVTYYHGLAEEQWPWDEWFDRHLSTYFQSHLAMLCSDLRLDRVLTEWLRGHYPRPRHVITLPDRSCAADFSKHANLAGHRAFKVREAREAFRRSMDRAITPEQWLEQAMELEPMVQQIQQRGGRVVFIRYPTSGEPQTLWQKLYPKEQYWDRFAQATSAETIHFLDVPTLRDFECADASHLNYDDAARFTEALAEELCRRGIIRRPMSPDAACHEP